MKQTPSLNRGKLPPLTDAEEEVMHLLTVERLTPKQAAHRRKCSPGAIYQIRRKLIRKGFITTQYRVLHKSGIGEKHDGAETTPAPRPHRWDFHGCKWRVGILEGASGERYRRRLGAGSSVVQVRGCTVELFRDVLKIHCDRNFTADHPRRARELSWDYLWRVLAVLENDYGLILMKHRVANIERYAGHFAHMNDEGGRIAGADRIRVFAEDGKLRFHIDWSKHSIPEAEFLHAHHAAEDAEYYEDHIRDLIAHRPPHLSQLVTMHAQLSQQVAGIAAALRSQTEAMNALLSAFQPPKPPESPVQEVRPFYVG